MSDGHIVLTQSLAESILENTAYPITWYNASVIDPFTGNYVTVTWGPDATGSGLVQADAAVTYFNSTYNQ